MKGEQGLHSFPQVLVNFVRSYERTGRLVCLADAETFASNLRLGFDLPAPLSLKDASFFVKKLEAIHVLYQPNLEHTINVRGLWMSFGDNNYIFIEAERPSPSQIRTLVHEVSEKMRKISYLLHPEIPEETDRPRETWANRVAAAVKMPPELFLRQVDELGLDLELLKVANDETLAGVARRVRDLVMQGRVYYWCRFDIAPHGLKKCDKLAQVAQWLGGACVRVVDVTHTSEVDYSRRGNSLPSYNLPSYYHYRILNPLINRYIANKTPVFFQTLEGGASGEYAYYDLFGEYQLSILLVPYGIRQTRGFFLVAVHPRDRCLLQPALERLQPEIRGGIDWLFSWYSYTHKQTLDRPVQIQIPGLGDMPPEYGGLFAKQFGCEPYRWPISDEADSDIPNGSAHDGRNEEVA